jgi:hypothetical protein
MKINQRKRMLFICSIVETLWAIGTSIVAGRLSA